jgi:hypothetical protein
MQCARAFEACITMRDDDKNAEIPDRFEPSDYSAKELLNAKAELIRLELLTIEHRQSEADAAYDEDVAFWDRYEAEKVARRSRYENMLSHVISWTPPTENHASFKSFMIEQITKSIDHDCSPELDKRPTPIDCNVWFANAVSKCAEDIVYHTKENAAEVERAETRTKWVADLRASLKAQAILEDVE